MAKKTILIVDDDPVNIDFLEGCLLESGYQTLSAENGEAALKSVTRTQPDMILLDVNMRPIFQ